MSDVTPRFRPWVQIASFCQIALKEGNQRLSLIRIVDRITINGQTPEMQPTSIQTTLVVILKSDFMRGPATVGIRPVTPSGGELPVVETNVLFEGDDRGIQLIIPVAVTAQEQGLYWFEVLVDGEIFTRVPLRVMYQRIAVQGQQAGGGPGLQGQ